MLKLSTTMLATETTAINLAQLKNLLKKLKTEAGYMASGKDLFSLVAGGRDGVYEKLVFNIIGESPISHFAIQKIGPVYTVMMCRSNKAELTSSNCKSLINIIEEYKPSAGTIAADTIKSRNLEALKVAINKAKNEKGKNASVADAFRFLMPNLYMGNGRFVHYTPIYKVTFNCMLRNMIVEIEDVNHFKLVVTKAIDLEQVVA